jgi:hypothetical protein
MHHLRRRHSLKLERVDAIVGAWVVVQHLIGNDVADGVELQAIDRAAVRSHRLRHQLRRRGDHLGLDEPQVELHARHPWIRNHQGECFAVDRLGICHRPQLAGKVDGPRPVKKQPLHLAVDVWRAGIELQARAGADQVVGLRLHDPGEVGVVRPLIPSTVADLPAHHRRECRIRRKRIGVRPVLAVVALAGGVVPGTHAQRHCYRL